MTLAVTRSEEMAAFYNQVFVAGLERIESGSLTLFRGTLAGIPLLLCPAEIAGIDAKQNRLQLRFEVEDLQSVLRAAVENGGELLGEPDDGDGEVRAAVRDPDGNSIEFVQRG